jgi:hypothetical protein
VKENDLEPEVLDDFLRAASELTERDIEVLAKVAEVQRTITTYKMSTNDGTTLWIPRFVILPEGEKFLQRLRDVAD